MNTIDLQIPQNHVHKLLCAAHPDAALLYLYIQSGNDPQSAPAALHLSPTHFAAAEATLRQLGLWPEEKRGPVFSGERPQYSERDVMTALDTSRSFQSLHGEVQRLLGRSLNTEELKILLGLTNYLGFPQDVISILICYCRQRARERGNLRAPSLRTIEKEAYHWAELGIETMEQAVAYMQHQNRRRSQLGVLMDTLQVRGRSLTPGEERYARSWLEMGFGDGVIALAYERTCLNTGGLNWAYMNKILTRWHEGGLHTLEQIRDGDKKPRPKGASGNLGQAELDALQKLLQEG